MKGPLVPKMITKLRLDPYQEEGAAFLAARRKAWLCDVPGLGKTAQAIAAWDARKMKTIIVVCPGIVRQSWRSAIPQFANASRKVNVISTAISVIEHDAVNIVSYDLLLNEKVMGELIDLKADCLVLDESHYLKEPDAKRTNAVLGEGGLARSVGSVWMLTGTPMPNHPGELWTTLATLFPNKIPDGEGGILDYDNFVMKYCLHTKSKWGIKIRGARDPIVLKEMLKDVMLRRTWDDVGFNLPPLRMGDWVIEHDGIQDEDTQLWASLEEKDHSNLRQAIEDGIELDNLVGDKHIATLRRFTGLAKVRAAMKVIADELHNDPTMKVVVFAIHRDVLKLAHEYMRDEGFKPGLIYGGSAPNRKNYALARFTGGGSRVLLLQMKVASTGLDGLQHASNNVVILEPDWSPFVNFQAVARLHRRGQRRPVLGRFLSLSGSLDEEVSKTLVRKTRDVAAIIGL